MFSLRKKISTLDDRSLVNLASESAVAQDRLASKFKKDGFAPIEEVTVASELAEIGTVAKAIGKDRVESGGQESHMSLRSQTIGASAKRLDRSWGKWMSERRV